MPYFKPGKELKELINREPLPPAAASAPVTPGTPVNPSADPDSVGV